MREGCRCQAGAFRALYLNRTMGHSLPLNLPDPCHEKRITNAVRRPTCRPNVSGIRGSALRTARYLT
jgi:hypothetical protein